jgi:SAM-dependent methyltransferase
MTVGPVRAFSLPLLLVRSERALRYARRHDLPGVEFGAFGRRLGRRLLIRSPRFGLRLLLTPVHSVRYFEFAFADAVLPAHCVRCLDVSSPRLFSLFLSATGRAESILVVNPDERDVDETRLVARRLGLSGLHAEPLSVDSLRRRDREFDAVWSLSVLEHIEDDSAAIALLYGALAPGGRLVVSVPVDRRMHVERRSGEFYGTHGGERFFQRFYDERSLRSRLLEALPTPPAEVRWFGERRAGHWAEYERSWIARGHAVTVDDPRTMTDEWREFGWWDEMPGIGVCALVVEKPM